MKPSENRAFFFLSRFSPISAQFPEASSIKKQIARVPFAMRANVNDAEHPPAQLSRFPRARSVRAGLLLVQHRVPITRIRYAGRMHA